MPVVTHPMSVDSPMRTRAGTDFIKIEIFASCTEHCAADDTVPFSHLSAKFTPVAFAGAFITVEVAPAVAPPVTNPYPVLVSAPVHVYEIVTGVPVSATPGVHVRSAVGVVLVAATHCQTGQTDPFDSEVVICRHEPVGHVAGFGCAASG